MISNQPKFNEQKLPKSGRILISSILFIFLIQQLVYKKLSRTESAFTPYFVTESKNEMQFRAKNSVCDSWINHIVESQSDCRVPGSTTDFKVTNRLVFSCFIASYLAVLVPKEELRKNKKTTRGTQFAVLSKTQKNQTSSHRGSCLVLIVQGRKKNLLQSIYGVLESEWVCLSSPSA